MTERDVWGLQEREEKTRLKQRPSQQRDLSVCVSSTCIRQHKAAKQKSLRDNTAHEPSSPKNVRQVKFVLVSPSRPRCGANQCCVAHAGPVDDTCRSGIYFGLRNFNLVMILRLSGFRQTNITFSSISRQVTVDTRDLSDVAFVCFGD